MSMVPKIPKINLSPISLKRELNKEFFIKPFNLDRLNALKKYLREVYDIPQENINCFTDNYCVGYRPATEREIRAWNKYYEETGEFANSYYDYAIDKDGHYYYIHIIERLNGSEELEIEIHSLD